MINQVWAEPRPAEGELGVQVRRPRISYPGGWAAFDRGDYAYAATHAGEDALLRGAALIMLGHYEGGVPILEGVGGPESLYYQALALWGRRDNRLALGCLDDTCRHYDLSEALRARIGRLRDLIGGPPPRVLVQAQNQEPPSSFSIVSAMKQTSCEVLSVGYQSTDDYVLDPYARLADVLARLPRGWRPDFYHCYQVESNLMPVGLSHASFPVIGYVSDYDTRIHTCFFRAQGCDAMVVTGGVDHYEVAHGIGLPTIVFPKAVGIHAAAFAEVDPCVKDCEVFCSGTTMSFYQLDKGRMIYRLMQLSDRHRVRIHRGFLPANQYVRETARAKAVFSFVRRQPVWSSRALEALAGGAVALYQERGGLDLFFQEEEGAVPYREDNLEAVVERVVTQWEDRYARAALRGRARTLKEFDLMVCMERYLKRLALLASTIDASARRRGGTRPEVEWRHPPFARGAFVASAEHKKRVWAAGFEGTVARIEAIPAARRSSNDFNTLGFSYFALGYRAWQSGQHGDPKSVKPEAVPHIARSLAVYAQGCQQFPRHVVLPFNFARVCWNVGKHREAYRVFGDLLRAKDLMLEPLDDVFGDDFATRYFPYRAYVDALMGYLVTKDRVWHSRMFKILMATVWWYRGVLEVEQGRPDRAVSSFEACLKRFNGHPQHHDFFNDVPWRVQDQDTAVREAAVEHLKMAWTLAPLSTRIMAMLIQCLRLLGRTAEAEDYLAKYDRVFQSVTGVPVEDLRNIVDPTAARQPRPPEVPHGGCFLPLKGMA